MSTRTQPAAVEVDSIGWRGVQYEAGDIIEYTHFVLDVTHQTKLWERHQGRIERLFVTPNPQLDILMVRADVYTTGGRSESVWFHRAGELVDMRHVRNCGKLGDTPEGALF